MLIILTFVNTFLCSKVQKVDVELDSEIEIMNISNKTDLKLFELKEDNESFSEIFRQRVQHVNNICRIFNQDVALVG